MHPQIIAAAEYVNTLIEKYDGLEIPIYKLRKLFAVDSKVFFDCEDSDVASCLTEILNKPDFPAFRIYLVVKDVTAKSFSFMDVNFRNLVNKETLEHFMNRYHRQLETMTKLSLQGAGREYVECIGHSYEESTP